MNFEDARAATYTRLKTYWDVAHPTVPVEYENQDTIDLDQQTAPFLTCEIVYNDSEQIAMGTPGGHRHFGAIWLSFWVKQGQGTALQNTALKELQDLFGEKAFGGVNTRAARRVPSRPQKAWYVASLRVPFWIDDFS